MNLPNWRVLPLCLSVAASAALLPGCGSDPSPAATSDVKTDGSSSDTTTTTVGVAFPKGFLWGAAIAGFQVDMGCPTLPAAKCDDPNSDWYQWVMDPDLQKDPATHIVGDPVSKGPGFWELWPKYLDAGKNDLHLGALRYSLEWSRLFPDGAVEKVKTVEEMDAFANKEAVAAYHAIFKGARDRKMQLLVTLNHYTLPLWIHDGKACHQDLATCKNRGWVDKDRMLSAIAMFSGWCAKEFGAEVDLWGTINEPFAVVVPGYILPTKDRSNPPGLTMKIDTAFDVAFALMEGHARMYDAVHKYDKQDADGDGKPARVGIVSNLAAVKPQDPNDPKHVKAAEHGHYVYNQLFLDATIKGQVDRNVDGAIDATETRDDMKGRMDFIGINYYTRLKVTPQPVALAPKYPLFDFLPNTNPFDTYPEGIYEVVKFAAGYGLPIIITENGAGDPKGEIWEKFLKPHLLALHKAIAEGAKVEGYFYWSLMDNYEWNHGMFDVHMGLYDVDTATKAFTLAPPGQAYGKVAQNNGFDP